MLLESGLAAHSRIRVLAVDIDGTLLNTKAELPPRNRAALEEAHRAGVEVVLVTGRRFPFALPIARLLPFEVTIIASNGALIKSSGGRAYCREFLDRDVAAGALALTRPWLDHAVLAYDSEGPGQLVLQSTEKRSAAFLAWLEQNRQFVTFAPLEQALAARPDPPLQVMYSGAVAELRTVERTLLESPLSSGFRLFKTEYESRDFSIVDIINPRCSKGDGLRAWVEQLGIPREQVMAVGDNFNDREMLEFAGLPVVMGNAVDDLLGLGWEVTGHCDQAGLADAIERWIL